MLNRRAEGGPAGQPGPGSTVLCLVQARVGTDWMTSCLLSRNLGHNKVSANQEMSHIVLAFAYLKTSQAFFLWQATS